MFLLFVLFNLFHSFMNLPCLRLEHQPLNYKQQRLLTFEMPNRCDFVVGMLVAMGVVTDSDIAPLVKRFTVTKLSIECTKLEQVLKAKCSCSRTTRRIFCCLVARALYGILLFPSALHLFFSVTVRNWTLTAAVVSTAVIWLSSPNSSKSWRPIAVALAAPLQMPRLHESTKWSFKNGSCLIIKTEIQAF
jgi:hypothetical protein